MALSVNALTTYEVVREELGIQHDATKVALYERYINAGSDLFEKQTGRKWYYKAAHQEHVKGYGTELLRLRDFVPVSTLTSIEFDRGASNDTIDSSLYELAEETLEFPAYIRRRSGAWTDTRDVAFGITPRRVAGSARALYIVTYDGGYITPYQASDDYPGGSQGARTLPYDVEDAVLDYVAMRVAQAGTDTTVRRIEMDDGVIEWNRQRIPQSLYTAIVNYQVCEVG